jgi:hypothetical protein
MILIATHWRSPPKKEIFLTRYFSSFLPTRSLVNCESINAISIIPRHQIPTSLGVCLFLLSCVFIIACLRFSVLYLVAENYLTGEGAAFWSALWCKAGGGVWLLVCSFVQDRWGGLYFCATLKIIDTLGLIFCARLFGRSNSWSALLYKAGAKVCSFVQRWGIMTLCTTLTPTVCVVRSAVICSTFFSRLKYFINGLTGAR